MATCWVMALEYSPLVPNTVMSIGHTADLVLVSD